MSVVRLSGVVAAGAALGVLAASMNGTPLLPGLAGGVIAGELAALLAPRDEDDGGIAEEVAEPVLTPLPTHG